MNLPNCPVCDAIPTFFRRRKGAPYGPTYTGVGTMLTDVLKHSCGHAVERTGKVEFKQPAGGNGFVPWGAFSQWETITQCPEATRILTEMREAKS